MVGMAGSCSWKSKALQVLMGSDIADPELMVAAQMQTDRQAFCLKEN